MGQFLFTGSDIVSSGSPGRDLQMVLCHRITQPLDALDARSGEDHRNAKVKVKKTQTEMNF